MPQPQKRLPEPSAAVDMVAQRSCVYDGLRNCGSLKKSFPLLNVFALGQKNLEQLQNAVASFVLASLRLSHNKAFPYRSDFLTAYAAEIATLPNLTPNGACYPKRETVLEYNILHREVVVALQDAGVLQHLRMITPLNLRVMLGTSSVEKDKRPYSTAKKHSDAWIGHTSDGIASLLVMGDVTGTRVEFFEPVNPTPDFFNELTDYEQGLARFDDLQRYPAEPSVGDLFLFDHLALHQTVREHGGTRISIGFGYVVDSPASRSAGENPARFDYMERDDWASIGSTSLQLFDESMAELAELYGSSGAKITARRYAPFRFVSLWPKQIQASGQQTNRHPTLWLRKREERFAAICERFPHTKPSPLIACHEIRSDLFEKYGAAVEVYNDASARSDFVNLTPAGMLMPKREIAQLYSEVTAHFLDICTSLNITDLIKAWNIPAIRHKRAEADPEHLKRLYVSEDAHADVWIGWSPDSLLFMTPVLGDTKRNWVRFFCHPDSADESWAQKLPSFRDEKGQAMLAQCEPLPKHYEPGCLYIADIAAIHQTVRDAGAGWRVGMEMAGYLEEPADDSLAAGTAFSPAEAEALRIGRKKFECDLKMGEIGDYSSAKRAIDIHLIDY